MYRQGGACDEDEWVTSGGFAVCDLAQGYRCDPRCYCDASFLSLTRNARCTMAEVVEVEDADIDIFKDQMTQHLMFDWKAPDFETARGVAEEEIDYTAGTRRHLSRPKCGSPSIASPGSRRRDRRKIQSVRSAVAGRAQAVGIVIGHSLPGDDHCYPVQQIYVPSKSTSNSSVAFGGITPPAPRAP